MVGLGVLVELDGDWSGDGVHGDVVAVDEEGGFALAVGSGDVFGGGFDGDLAGFVRGEGEVVVGVEDGQDAGV